MPPSYPPMIYLDHAATAPLDPRVRETVLAALDLWGNPSSPHARGREARAAIDRSRKTVADLLGVQPQEVIFVSNGSEGNSLALFGIAEKWIDDHGSPGHIVTASIEHECSLKAAARLRHKGWRVTLLPVDADGILRMDILKEALTDDTALVSLQWANNEVGTIQPVEEAGALCAERNIPFHCDAVQGTGLLPLPSPIPDLMTIAAHKFGGPKGIGALIVREHVHLQPLIMGGGQEFGLRAGTENTPAIVGMATALELALAEQPELMKRLTTLRAFFEGKLITMPGVSINGHPEKRIPSITNARFKGKSGETIMIQLDLAGICVSTGAACATGVVEPSHVLQAMGRSAQESGENVRFSFGRDTTKDDLDATIGALQISSSNRSGDS